MGWRDRDYNQTAFGGYHGFKNPLWFLLFGSIPLGTWFGIRVRVHMSLVLLIAFSLLFAQTRGGMGVANALTSSIILFSIVLLHEFGHCFAARSVHGEASDILLWPLGGLAAVHTPRRAWPTFVAAAGGPLVNVLLCAASALIMLVWSNFDYSLLPLNPLLPFSSGQELGYSSLVRIYRSHVLFYCWWVYSVSWSILIFNLLPIFPMDGGRILQALLWPKFGYHKSMNFACITGMIGAVLMGMFGLATFQFLLVFLAASGFLVCYQTRLMLKTEGPEEPWQESLDYSSNLHDEPKRIGRRKKGWFRTASRKAAKERAEQARIDAILAKVHDKGLHSLTWWEKRTLRKATERQRQQDQDLAQRY